MVYVYSLPLTPAVILSFVSSQMAPLMQAYKQHELYVTVMIPVAIWYMNARSYVELELPQPPFNLLPSKNVRIYIETAIVVVISYVSLLIVNWSHIWLVIFPIIAISFIVVLCSQLTHLDHHQGGSQEQSNEGEGEGEGEATAPSGSGNKAEGLEAVALVPYWALCVMGHFHADRFAVSQFLLFFSFTLGALTMMMTRLAGLAGAAHCGIAPASELLRKASLVVLLVAVHAMAAELLGENVLLYCLPEMVPVLLWLSIRLDCDNDRAIIVSGTAADMIKLLVVAAAVVLAANPAMIVVGNLDESVLYWCGKALVSCVVSALLTLYIVFMLCQWPGGGQRDGSRVSVTATASLLQEAVGLLMYWAMVLLAAAATLLAIYTSLAFFQLVLLQEPASTDQILQRLFQKFLQFVI